METTKRSQQIKDFQFVLSEEIQLWKKIVSNYQVQWKESFLKWDNPISLGIDFSLTFAIEISAKLRRNPYDVASEIVLLFPSLQNLKFSVEQGGYINFKFKNEFYSYFLNNLQLFVEFAREEKKINVEYVSTNPTGFLHLGHLRNAIVGDAIANIYDFIGFEVTREYYINDRGSQIKKISQSVLFYYCKKLGIKFSLTEEEISYRSPDIILAADHFISNRSFSENEIIDFSSSIQEEIIDYFVDKIRGQLFSINIKFDRWFSEKKMYEEKQTLSDLLNNFRSKNFLFESEGATFLRTSSLGDDKDRVIIKADGEFTYFLSDIIYHLNKLSRSDLLVNVWGSDHHGYIERLLSSLKILGNQKEISIVLIQMVSLLTDDGDGQKFSKRLNNTIGLSETLNLISVEELKFSILEKDANHRLLINIEELRIRGKETRLHHIQYAHARCNSLLIKWKRLNDDNDFEDWTVSPDFLLLKLPEEKSLLKIIFRFKDFVNLSAERKNPSIICYYLSDLSKSFHSYYHLSRIIEEEKRELSRQRIILVRSVMIVLGKCLRLLGIEPLREMKSSKELFF